MRRGSCCWGALSSSNSSSCSKHPWCQDEVIGLPSRCSLLQQLQQLLQPLLLQQQKVGAVSQQHLQQPQGRVQHEARRIVCRSLICCCCCCCCCCCSFGCLGSCCPPHQLLQNATAQPQQQQHKHRGLNLILAAIRLAGVAAAAAAAAVLLRAASRCCCCCLPSPEAESVQLSFLLQCSSAALSSSN